MRLKCSDYFDHRLQAPYTIDPMLKKSKFWEPTETLPTKIPTLMGVLDQSHQILMPFVKTSIRIWDPLHKPLMEALLEADPAERWCIVVHRELCSKEGFAEEPEGAVLVRVERIERCEHDGYDLELDCLERIVVGTRNNDVAYERSEVQSFPKEASLGGDISARLDQLVQAAFQLAQGAHQAHVQLGALLDGLPHRRALLYRMAALLIQNPGERLDFLLEPSTSHQIDIVSIFMARALQVMGRRRDRNLAVGP